jgi:hypothetical protein
MGVFGEGIPVYLSIETSIESLYQLSTAKDGIHIVGQDQQAVFGAASVNVATGYMDDPADLPGLAHFLEHAVHLVRRIVVGKEAPFPGERAAPLSHARRR